MSYYNQAASARCRRKTVVGLASADKISRAADDLDATAGMLRRNAKNIHASVAVVPLGLPPPSCQSQSCSPHRRRGRR